MGFGQWEERWESSPLSERRSNLDSNLGHMATVMNFYKSEYEQHSIKKTRLQVKVASLKSKI